MQRQSETEDSGLPPNKNWPSSLERGMLLVRRTRRWALEKLRYKIRRHDDSKTISWHASFPVRFARVLAALRLNSPLRGSDSGSLGRQHRKPHDGSLATVRVICFRIHHGCIILRTMFYNAVLFAHCQKLLACPGSLKRKAFSNHRYLLKNFPFP